MSVEVVKCAKPLVVDDRLLPCGKKSCRSCHDLWKRNWVGRLTAESLRATVVRFVTLTYSDENVDEGKALPPEHVHRYFQWRRKKYDVRHLTVGEFGEKTGRPHWHSLQFYYGCHPDEALDFSQRNPHWKWGNSQYQTPRSVSATAFYCLDYLSKGGVMLRPSPNIGKAYLVEYGRTLARNRRDLITRGSLRYTVPGATNKRGVSWEFRLHRSHPYMAEIADAYLEEWESNWNDLPYDELKGIEYG